MFYPFFLTGKAPSKLQPKMYPVIAVSFPVRYGVPVVWENHASEEQKRQREETGDTG